MLQRLLGFIENHPIVSVVTIVVLSTGGVAAAFSPSLFNIFISSNETVTSVDNSALLNADLDNFDVDLKIDSIKENTDNYRVDYSHMTLGVNDGFWREIRVDKSLNVGKATLTKDESINVQLARRVVGEVETEILYLKQVQKEEQAKGQTSKVVTTTYSGILGSLIGSTNTVVENNSQSSNTNTSNTSSTSTSTNSTLNENTVAEEIEEILATIPPVSPNPNPNSPVSPTPTPPPPSPSPTPVTPTPPPPSNISTTTPPTPPPPIPSPTPPPISSTWPAPTPIPTNPEPDVVDNGPLPE